MAPGSRGARAVFVCFSGEDSGQTGDAICYPNINLRGEVIQVEEKFFDLNAELKTIFNQQKQI